MSDRRHRAVTLDVRRISKRELAKGRRLYPVADHGRPATRGECEGAERPCPFVSCRYHLYLDVNPLTGAIKINFPHLDVDELAESCALDVADRGGAILEEVGNAMNLTRERTRQIEVQALERVRRGRALEESERGFVGWVEDIQGRPLAAPVAKYGDGACKRCGADFARMHHRQTHCDSCKRRPPSSVPRPKVCERCGADFMPANRKRHHCDPCREAAIAAKAPPMRRCMTCAAEFRPTHGRHAYCESCRDARAAAKKNRKGVLTICGVCGSGFRPNRKQMNCDSCRERFGKPFTDALAALRRKGFSIDIELGESVAIITATEAAE